MYDLRVNTMTSRRVLMGPHGTPSRFRMSIHSSRRRVAIRAAMRPLISAAMRPAVLAGSETRVVDHVRQIQRVAQPLPRLRGARARSRWVHPTRGRGRKPPGPCGRSRPGRQFSGCEVRCDREGEHADQAVHHGGLHLLAAPRPVPLAERRQDAESGIQPCHRVADRHAHPEGSMSAVPFKLMKPDMAWAMKSKAGRSRYGPVLPKPVTAA